MTPAAVPTTAPSPTTGFWHGWDDFFASFPGRAVIAAIIVLVALLLAWTLRLAIRHTVERIVSRVKRNQNVETTQALQVSPVASVRIVQRSRTLGTVLTNIANAVITVLTILLVINELAPNVLGSLALLSAALGAGLGFGAQNIVKDVLNGLFLVIEDQLGIGDVVDTGFATGVVEAVGIRVTQIRDVNGTLWYVRNGEMIRVGNASQGWARVITDLAVPYETDVENVQDRVLAVAQALATDAKWRSRVVDRPELWGIQSISDSAVVLRVVVKVRSTARDDVARELNTRLVKDLEDAGIALPSLATVVLSGFDGAASVTGAHPPRTRPVPAVTTEQTKPKRGTRRRGTAVVPPAPAPKPQQGGTESPEKSE